MKATNQPSQKEVWNAVAPSWASYKKSPLPEVSEFLKDKTGNILDLACGSGRHFQCIKGTVYGVDFSDEMLRLAREANTKKSNSNLNLIKAEADNLPFENNLFDSAIYIAGLHCIDSEIKRKKSLLELYRVLKPNAEALITVWSKNHKRLKNKEKEALLPWTVNGIKYKRYYYIYGKEELESLLKETGFKIINSEENENIVIIVKKI